MKKIALILALLLLILSGCEKDSAEITDPAAQYAEIAAAAQLPEMLALTADELLYMIGIEPTWYTDAAAYTALSGTSPEEILIFRAADADAAVLLREALDARLKYKQDSAKLYLTENQDMLRGGTVRTDGLTVSLIVCADMEAALSVYPK